MTGVDRVFVFFGGKIPRTPITTSQARKIRKVVFNRDDLHGIMRGDLFQPVNGSVNNPVFRMIYLGGFYPGIYQYLRIQREAGISRSMSADGYMMWRDESFVPSALVTSVLYETYAGFVKSLPMIYSEACRDQDTHKFAVLSMFDSRKISQFASWQTSPVNLKFESSLIKLLSDTSSSQKIPRELLARLPYWSVCVETPGLELKGANINYIVLSINSEHKRADRSTNGRFLTLLISVYSETRTSWSDGTFSYDLEVETVEQDTMLKSLRLEGSEMTSEKKSLAEVNDFIVKTGVAVALYISSREPDYDRTNAIKNYGKHSTSNSSKAPKAPHEFAVGQILASSLKKLSNQHGQIYSNISGRTVSPHWRKAHWHTFWA